MVVTMLAVLSVLSLMKGVTPIKADNSSETNTSSTQQTSEKISAASPSDSSGMLDATLTSEQSTGKQEAATRAINPMSNLQESSLATDGTGIVAKNIAKTMTDIQGYKGDTEAIKQMIINDSGAKAYGLSAGGAVTDVTDGIQIADLNGLDTVASNNLQEFHITLTVPANVSGTGSDLSSEVIVYIGNVSKVSTWSQLDTALMSNTVTIIDVQNSMTNTSATRADRTVSDSRPNYVLLGNGNSLDFIGYSYRWGTNTSVVHKAVVDNVDMYGGHYYGPVTMWDRNAYGSSITYRNVNYTGAQVTASFQAVLRFEGKNVIKSKATQYTSYNGTVRTMADNNQSGLESHTLVFGANTDTTIEAENGDGVILGSWYSNWDTVATIQPSLTLEENATATIRTLGNTGETNSWQTAGGSIPSVISVQRNGKIDVGKNANLNVETADGTTRVPVRLGYQAATSQWTTSINLAESSNFNININGPISNDSSRAGIMLQQNSAINVGDNAEMVINANKMTTGTPVISMGQSAKLSVAQKGSLALNKNGGTGRLLDLSTGSQFNVSDLGVADFNSFNEGASTSSMIYAGNGSSFIIGDKGTFQAKIKDGTGNRNMLDFGTNTTFQFANAQKVDLDARGNTNVNIVNMSNPGTFKADIQAVSAWSKAEAAKTDPTYNWTPMYGVNVNYNGITTTKVTGNSVTSKLQNDFVANYRTENFSRILYDYIPDIVIGLNQPSDNKTLASGQKLTGIVNNNAGLLFYKVVDENDSSKDILLTDPTAASPIEGDTQKFHTVANSNGEYSYTLPDNVVLQAGDKIKAYGWLNGKDNFTIQTVLDKTPPSGESVTYEVGANDPLPDASVFVKNPTDTNPTPQNFSYAFNAETPKSTVENYMKTVGEYTVKVDLSDEAGNVTTITSKLIVYPYSRYISGTSFDVLYEDIKELSEAELKNYILKNSAPTAYVVKDGTKTDLTNKIIVSDLGGLANISSVQAQSYPVTLSVPASDAGLSEDLSTIIQVTVKDTIPPKAKSKVTPVKQGDSAAITGDAVDLKTFLAEVSDNVTPVEAITAELDEKQDIDSLVATTGPKELKIKLTDASGNSAVITTQIFVYDDTFIVGKTGLITGQDYSMDSKEFDAEDARKLTISEGKVKAYDISGETAIDVTNDTVKFTVDTSLIGEDTDTPYPIKLSVNDAEKTIHLTLTKPALAIVDPTDGETSFTPEDPKTNEPLKQNTVDSGLRIQYVSGFDFGTNIRNLLSSNSVLSKGDYGSTEDGATKNVPAFVSINDDRKAPTGWDLSVSTTDFVNQTTNTSLKGAYMTLSDFKYNGPATQKPEVVNKNVEISSTPSLVSSSTTGLYGSWSLALGDITSDEKSSGVNLTVPKNSARSLGEYQTEIVWMLTPKI